MKSNIFTIIFINAFCSDNRSAKISADVFGHLLWFTYVGLGMNIETIYVIFVYGCIKLLEDRSYTASGIEYVVEHLKPQRIVVYGTAPAYIFDNVKAKGIEILQFDSDYSISRKGDYHGSR